jgi:WD40 repeat protein
MVFDTYTQRVIDNLDKQCKLGKDITNYACIIKKHPLNEHILLACFDGGITILYDVENREIIQEINEYGIYSIDQFTMNNAVDVDFSSDGEYIAFTSIYGTLSLYAL